MKIIVFLLLVICQVHCQINFGSDAKSKPTKKPPVATPMQKPIHTEEEIIANINLNKKIENAEQRGILPQQVLIRTRDMYTSSDCTGTMITDSLALTSGHCVADRGSDADVKIYPTEKNCGSFDQGISACKVLHQYTGNACNSRSHDIALVRLSRPMAGMRNLRLNFVTPRIRDNTVMAGTGLNNNSTCQSLISYQTIVDCSQISCSGQQWYCTKGTYKKISGACQGDSGGPSWTFGHGFSGLTTAATVSSNEEQCTNGNSLFTNLNFYKNWIERNMKGNMARCGSVRPTWPT